MPLLPTYNPLLIEALPATCNLYKGDDVPIPTFPDTYKPFEGPLLLLPMETPPLLLTINLVEPFTWARKGLTPEALLMVNLEVVPVEPIPQLPPLVILPRSVLFVIKTTDWLFFV